MNTYKIKFDKKSYGLMNDEVLETLWDYLAALYKNGQILKNYELISNSNELFAYATLPDDDALNEVNNNIYVNDYKDKICEHFEISFELIGKNLNQDSPCACKNSSWYLLYTDYTSIDSPVFCGDCGKAVPLYKLPHIRDYEYYETVTWQEAYKSVDRLWMYCLSDRFTLRQLHNPDSQLSKNGRQICKEFEEKTGKPFYYYLFQNRVTSKKCPICQNKWKLTKATSIIDYKCVLCRVVADEV